jgi:hypothetical protein
MKKIKDLPLKKKIAGILFLILILGTIIMMIVFKDSIITSYENRTFSNGCVEQYLNGKLQGDKCKIEMPSKYRLDFFELNITFNLTKNET